MMKLLFFALFITQGSQVLTLKVQKSGFIGKNSTIILSKEELPMPVGEFCKILVVNDDPIYQKFGKLHPKENSCKDNIEYHYQHFGSIFGNHDRIKLQQLTLIDNITRTQFFSFEIHLGNYDKSLYHVQELYVDRAFGHSDAINQATLLVDMKNLSYCKLSYFSQKHGYPLYGNLVFGNEMKTLTSVRRNCNEFFNLGLQYEHIKKVCYKLDIIPLMLEVRLKTGEEVIEFLSIPINLRFGYTNTPPTLASSTTLSLNLDSLVSTKISPSSLSFTDAQDNSDSLLYEIVKPVDINFGYLTNLKHGIKYIDSFYQSDLNMGNIVFRPGPQIKQATSLYVDFKVYDAQMLSSDIKTMHINVKLNDSSPLRTIAPVELHVFEGKKALISCEDIVFLSSIPLDRIIVHISGGPDHGYLTVQNKTSFRFTAKDICDNLVLYHHDASESDSDSVLLSVFDGATTVNTKLALLVHHVNDMAPAVVKLLDISCNYSSQVPITSDYLGSVDPDGDKNIFYNIIEGPFSGYIMDDNLKPVRKFTEAMLNDAAVIYKHNGSEIKDFFTFFIEDDNIPPNFSPTFKFHVNIIMSDIYEPVLNSSSLLELKIEEKGLKVLDTSVVAFSDQDSDPRNIWIEATERLGIAPKSFGSFFKKMVTNECQVMQPLCNYVRTRNWTMFELLYGRVIYKAEPIEIGLKPINMIYDIIAYDNHDHFSKPEELLIRIIPVDNIPPRITISDISVLGGQPFCSFSDHLYIVDEDTNVEEVFLHFFNNSLSGKLEYPDKIGDGHMSYKELMQNNLCYLPPKDKVGKDYLTVLISDNRSHVNITLKISFDTTEKLLINLIDPLVVYEGDFTHVSLDNLELVGEMVASMVLEVMKEPIFGSLSVNGTYMHSFTLDDVLRNQLTYTHSGEEIGVSLVKDEFILKYFNNSLTISVLIMPVNNKPPTIYSSVINVDEGSKVCLNNSHLNITDPDTNPLSFFLKFVSLPKYGFLLFNNESIELDAKVPVHAILQASLCYLSVASEIEPLHDMMTVMVEDDNNDPVTKDLDVIISPVNDESPSIHLTPSQLILKKGSSFCYDSQNIQVSDLDVPSDELYLRISKQPLSGILQFNETIWLESILYDQNPILICFYPKQVIHNETDLFVIDVSDGRHIFSSEVSIIYNSSDIINPSSFPPPILAFNEGLYMKHDQFMGYVSSEMLRASHALNHDIYYVIVHQPYNGVLQLHKSGEWLDINNNFTQEQIDNLAIRYKLIRRPVTNEDSFDFIVSDGISNSSVETFKVIFDPFKEEKWLLSMNVSGKFASFNCSTLNLTTLGLQDASSIVEVIDGPHQGIIFVDPNEPLTRIILEPLCYSEIKYVYLDKLYGGDLINDSFTLLVSYLNRSMEVSVFLNLYAPMDSLPVLRRIEPVLLTENSQVTLSSEYLFSEYPLDRITGWDLGDIFYLVTKAPSYGILLKNGLKIDSNTFTQKDLDSGSIVYSSNSLPDDGSDYFSFIVFNGLHDGFVYKGSLQKRDMIYEIRLFKGMEIIYDLRISSPSFLEAISDVGIGFVMSNQVLSPTVATARDVTYTILEHPHHGYLLDFVSHRVINNTFTQTMVNDNIIVYIINSTRDRVYEDSFVIQPYMESSQFQKSSYSVNLIWATVFPQNSFYEICEDEVQLTVPIMRIGKLDSLSFLTYEIEDITTEGNGVDYQTPTFTVIRMNPGEPTSFLRIHIIQDIETEATECFWIVLKSPINALLMKPTNIKVCIHEPTSSKCSETNSIETRTQDNQKIVTDESNRASKISTEVKVPNEGSIAQRHRDCEDGWLKFKGWCYLWVNRKVTWNAAVKACEQYDGFLSVIFNKEHNDFLVNISKGKPFWIGIKKPSYSDSWFYGHEEWVGYHNWKSLKQRTDLSLCPVVVKKGKWLKRSCHKSVHFYVCSYMAY